MRALPFRSALHAALLLVSAACAPKTKPPALNPPVPTVFAGLLQPQAPDAEVVPIPSALHAAVVSVLDARGLSPQPLADAALRSELGPARTPPLRLAYMVQAAAPASMIVLIETEAVFFAQLEGRNRWVVRVRLTIAPRDAPDQAVVDTFEAPVFLQFLHEKELRAVEEATPLITRRLTAALDGVIAARAAAAR